MISFLQQQKQQQQGRDNRITFRLIHVFVYDMILRMLTTKTIPVC